MMMAAAKTPQDRYVDADGLRLHYLDWGNDAAPPMLLLHGFSGHAHTWDIFAQAMSDRFHVVSSTSEGTATATGRRTAPTDLTTTGETSAPCTTGWDSARSS